ncbi:MAG: aminotransferase class IV family protein [Bacteroidales bacterium]|nr:aminotransferase class IV family protein [Bacteroidales bacterium]
MIWINGHIEAEKLLVYPRSSGTHWIYEVIRIIDGCPVFFKEHYLRLLHSLNKNNTLLSFSKQDLFMAIIDLVEIEKTTIGNIRIQTDILSGNTSIGFIPHHYPSQNDYTHGIRTTLIEIERTNPNIKSWNLSVREKADETIRNSQVSEVILVNQSGYLTEGSRSNIFGVKKDQLYTPPLISVLPGITRQIIIDLANVLNIHVKEATIHRSQLPEFDLFFISGTSPGILRVRQIDSNTYNCKSASYDRLSIAYQNKIKQNITQVMQPSKHNNNKTHN